MCVMYATVAWCSVADPSCLSRILFFISRILDPVSKKHRIRNKECQYFLTQNIIANLSEILTRMSIPDPDPRSGGQQITGSRTRNTGLM